MASLVVLALLFVAAFLGPTVYEAITGWNYSGQDFTAFLQPPSADHWFGTTQIGGDVFAQTMRGLQKSLLIGLLVAVISTGLAAVVGAVAGYFGGWVDRVLMWIVDLLLVIPSFLIIAIISGNLQGASWLILVVLIAVFAWMITARIIRGHDAEPPRARVRAGGPLLRGVLGRDHLPAPHPEHELAADHRRHHRGRRRRSSPSRACPTSGSASSRRTSRWAPSSPTAPGRRSRSRGCSCSPAACWCITTLAVSVFGDGLRDALDPASKRSGGKRVTVQEEQRRTGRRIPTAPLLEVARPDRRVPERRRRASRRSGG